MSDSPGHIPRRDWLSLSAVWYPKEIYSPGILHQENFMKNLVSAQDLNGEKTGSLKSNCNVLKKRIRKSHMTSHSNYTQGIWLRAYDTPGRLTPCSMQPTHQGILPQGDSEKFEYWQNLNQYWKYFNPLAGSKTIGWKSRWTVPFKLSLLYIVEYKGFIDFSSKAVLLMLIRVTLRQCLIKVKIKCHVFKTRN